MNAPAKKLSDEAARITALTAHDRSLLVEAGAGSGKTAIMAGRVAMMLAEGVAPRTIAAVTFTELAASELLARVRDFVDRLVKGDVPPELAAVLPNGPDAKQAENLERATGEIDELACSTIHGFCQRLIKPYPAEANIDPGAAIADRDQAQSAFAALRDSWIRERLSENGSALLAEMAAADPGGTVEAVTCLSECMARHPNCVPAPSGPLATAAKAFCEQVVAFRAFFDGAPCQENETGEIIAAFERMAAETRCALQDESPATLVTIVTACAEESLCTQKGFAKYQKKGKWNTAAKGRGLSKSEGDRLNDEASIHYVEACLAWEALIAHAASRLLTELMTEIGPLIDRFRAYKRSAALLDFDDLIFSARDLLLDHEDVRIALAKRYARVLVDEFQDTDPLQAEIFWRLCGEPAEGASHEDWQSRVLRPGALFCVGDAKQAIYRFRGADVAAYVQAREAIRARNPDDVISIATNFRSCASILEFVNTRFEGPLGTEPQPGFIRLDAFHPDREHPCVAALDLALPEKPSSELQRDVEADAVADLCARLIGSHFVNDPKQRGDRICRPGDIALLAPTGADLWRFEEALERRGIPVATQAGKGFFWRQEIQDLIALTRVLANSRDTLALGALLRGPVVGLTEEELLDLVWTLPREEGSSEPARLSLWTPLEGVTHNLAREVLSRLQSLARKASSTTPHDLLAQAVNELRLRPLLLARHRGQAERALANLDLYLNLSRPYAAAGLRAFAEAMTAAWEDESRAGEGRPDAQEDAVSLYTMHAAKGLEWPIVVPVNTSTAVIKRHGVLVARDSGHVFCRVLGASPIGYGEAFDEEQEEIARERVRLWYVAATRAREMLILPRPSTGAAKNSYLGIVDLTLGDLPAVDLAHCSEELPPRIQAEANVQTREIFALEAARVADASKRLTWIAPSREEGPSADALVVVEPEVIGSADPAEGEAPGTPSVKGGRERGLVMHKLFEEILTGEVEETPMGLEGRAAELLAQLGYESADSAADGFSAAEIASSVLRGLHLTEVAAVRETLAPECAVYAFDEGATEDSVTFGIADAIAFENRRPMLVIDWKSDVDPTPETIVGYRQQVAHYLAACGIAEGLIVFPTRGRVERVKVSL